jgi:hypothetical protein
MLPEEAAHALKLTSKEALQTAISRGWIQLHAIRPFGGRKTLYATDEVEAIVRAWLKLGEAAVQENKPNGDPTP